jgi:hypothetical protein
MAGMHPQILLAQFRSLLARAPNFENYSPSSVDHLSWLGQAHALVSRWNPHEARMFKLASDFLGGPSFLRDTHVAEVLGTLHRAVADLELLVPDESQTAFGPGAMYDFFKALNQVIGSAKSSLFIVDPYMDDGIFDAYLSSVASGIQIRLLLRDFSAKVKPAATHFKTQQQVSIEARKSGDLHDRVVFVDNSECWVLGHSIKDAAKSKPTYLAPLSPDVSALKLALYEKIWSAATAI